MVESQGARLHAKINTKARGGSAQRFATLLTIVFFSAYMLNVLSGKISTILRLEESVRLGDIPELFLLLGAVISFVTTTLLAATAQQSSKMGNKDNSTPTNTRES